MQFSDLVRRGQGKSVTIPPNTMHQSIERRIASLELSGDSLNLPPSPLL
jgi:hypothetical protein